MEKIPYPEAVDLSLFEKSSDELGVKYGLPKEVKYCKKCVISNQRPNSAVEYTHTKASKKATIHFDEEGVCDACRLAEQKHKVIDWEEREAQLRELCDRHRSKDGSYDCVVPGSGGKDSFYASHILKTKYGMHPLTVTWAPHKYTEWGWKNFQSWIHAGHDNYLMTPNGRVHRLLTRLAVENLFHPFQPFMFGQKFLAPKMAALFNIPLVFYGENEAEYGNPIEDASGAKRDWSYFTAEDKSKIFLGGTAVTDLKEYFGLSDHDLIPYMPANPQEIEQKKIEVHYLGYYLKWHPQSCYYYAVANGGFESSPERTPGTYTVEINLPPDYVVWATGDQLNEKDVFAEQTLERMNDSRNSSETIRILTPESYSGDGIFRKSHKGTWKFRAERVPDFAFACSNYYCWDANTLSLDAGDGKQVWINAVYPPDAVTFNRVADVAHQGIAYLSEVFPGIPYPFNKHISFNGIHHVAVEYPMMANNSDHASPEMYTELTVHEIAHNYIPFFMLSNERRHAWIDEGWVKLIGELYGETLGVARADKEALNTIQVYERFAGTSDDVPLIVPSGFMTVTHNFYHSYAKAANADKLLLDLMAEKGIGNPLKAFLLAWEGKHPTPYDFFYFMDGLTGEDLSWFWEPWYFNFSAPDLGIAATGEEGRVLITNHGGLPLPVKLTVVYDDKREQVIEKSLWEWSGGQQAIAVEIPEYEHAEMIYLGAPEIPDIEEGNNVLVLGTPAD